MKWLNDACIRCHKRGQVDRESHCYTQMVATLEQPATLVSLTDAAAVKIKELMAEEPASEAAVLRVAVQGGGCSGFQYKFDIERAKAEDDLVLAREGAVVLIDPVSVNYMAGSQIDFVDDLIGQSFKINNPQATASCGCGTSFSI